MRIGAQLRDCEIVGKLVENIGYLDRLGKELTKNNSTEPIPFMFLDGSSGMGKTQMAFTLMSREDLRVHYFVCSNLGDHEQMIYKKYQGLSLQLIRYLTADFQNNLMMSGFDYNFRSEACGFVVALITEQTYFQPLTVAEGSLKISSYCKENRHTNIIFLDEFPHLYGNQMEYLRWMRNLFRNLHLVTICSSTSSSVANLFRASSSSRDSDRPKDWCYVSPRFPKVLSGSGDNISGFDLYLFNNSRPQFSAIFEKIRSQCSSDDLSSILGSVGTQIHLIKMKFAEHFAHGQICFFMAINHFGSNTDSPGVFSNSHFANLVEEEDFILQIQSSFLTKKGSGQIEKWVPSLSFPNPKEDILLFLCLMGNKGYYPICEFNSMNRIPFRKSFMAIKELQKMQQITFNIHCENPHVITNTGLELEAIAVAIVSLCSHYHGLEGITFGMFLSHMLYELECLESSTETVSCENVYYKGFEEIVIPFLSAPSVPWPVELLESKYNFCNLRRTLNKERIDFWTDTFDLDNRKRSISGECKDWSSDLPRTQIENSLVRIPHNSIIHLVFTNTMSVEYYGPRSKGKTYQAFLKGNPHLEKKLILKFDPESKQLVPIPGIPMDKSSNFDGLVLFLCLDESF